MYLFQQCTEIWATETFLVKNGISKRKKNGGFFFYLKKREILPQMVDPEPG